MVDAAKELEPRSAGVERVSLPPVETSSVPKENLEVESWIAKIEKKFSRMPSKANDVTDDRVVIDQSQAQQPPVTLPVTQQQMLQGKKAKVDTGIAWLVMWAIRQIKQLSSLGRTVHLQDNSETK